MRFKKLQVPYKFENLLITTYMKSYLIIGVKNNLFLIKDSCLQLV